MVFRYQDSFDDVNNVIVIVEPTNASNIEGLGSPDKFLQDRSYLFGQTAFFGERGARLPRPLCPLRCRFGGRSGRPAGAPNGARVRAQAQAALCAALRTEGSPAAGGGMAAGMRGTRGAAGWGLYGAARRVLGRRAFCRGAQRSRPAPARSNDPPRLPPQTLPALRRVQV